MTLACTRTLTAAVFLAVTVFGSRVVPPYLGATIGQADGDQSAESAPGPIEWTPHTERAYRLVNSVAFSEDDRAMYVALLHQEVLAFRGAPDDTAPVTALFSMDRTAEGWGEPELLPFSGTYQDYEATLSGDLMVFNSKRPYPDGRIPEVNDLYLVQRHADGGWGEPRSIAAINTFDYEESYGSLTDSRDLVFLRGHAGSDGEPQYDLYVSTFANGEFQAPSRHPVSTDRYGEGDPWIAPDGSYLFFTRWDDEIGWAESVDLYISFHGGGEWSEPLALEQLNTPGADFGVAVSPDGRWLYYKNGSEFFRRPLAPILEHARAASRARDQRANQ